LTLSKPTLTIELVVNSYSSSSVLRSRIQRSIRAYGAGIGRVALLGVVVAISATGSDAQTIQPTWGAQGHYLKLDGQIPVVERPNGQRSPVPTRAGESISGFVELDRGWIATGTRPGTPRRQGHSATVAGSRDLLLITGGNGPIRRMTPPRSSGARIRSGATPVHSEGALVGLVWLEGETERSLAVRAADWTGVSWGPSTVISAPGAGSQIALSAAVAEDGTWIAAWSRFDGRDDEIYTSERRGANWSHPKRVHSRHEGPDITPALTATDDGVLLAWSRFDGDDYRTVVARWKDGKWSTPQSIAPKATAFPSFTRQDGKTYLLYQNLRPGGWTVAELSSSGSAMRRTASIDLTSPRNPAANVGNQRPLVVDPHLGNPTLSWPSHRKTLDLVWEIQP